MGIVIITPSFNLGIHSLHKFSYIGLLYSVPYTSNSAGLLYVPRNFTNFHFSQIILLFWRSVWCCWDMPSGITSMVHVEIIILVLRYCICLWDYVWGWHQYIVKYTSRTSIEFEDCFREEFFRISLILHATIPLCTFACIFARIYRLIIKRPYIFFFISQMNFWH